MVFLDPAANRRDGIKWSRVAAVAYRTGGGYVPGMTEKTASFGFREVPEGEKESLVKEVFSSVAARYDLMNDLMSAGVHRIWKDAMVEWLNPRPGWKVLDVAGGTGDIAFRIVDMARTRKNESSGGETPGKIQVTVCDINAAMLGEGVRRAEAKGETAIEWVCGNAEGLPFPDASFDAYTIAFGIRNVTHIEQALAEARRVLKPGGRFLCLEFSKVEVPGLDTLYDAYSFKLLPKIGGWVAQDEESYRYLAESIRRFPPQAKFAGMIGDAGLGQVKVRNLSGGIAAMHSAWRL
jgi:demethylmenaquinone methyltransferase/2-methoxy-6-polyprenyl-1,4-benzoquinol methylase